MKANNIVFKDADDLQKNLVNPMNQLINRDFFKIKVAEKYTKVVCITGCKYENWFNFDWSNLAPTKIKYDRSIQTNHTIDAHITFFKKSKESKK